MRVSTFPYTLLYGFDWTYILVLIGALLSIIASSRVKSTFNKFSRVANARGLTGAQVAATILKSEGIYDVAVVPTSGSLTDNFNPKTKRVNLSEGVYDSASVAAIGVAAHECGHAMQHNEGYFPLKVRSAFVPVANLGSKLGMPMIIAGLLLVSFMNSYGPYFLVRIGIVLFSFGMIFQIITLPVEFDASRRALATLQGLNLLEEEELTGARKVLKSAAMTYVAAAAASILTVLRLLLLFGNGGKRRS